MPENKHARNTQKHNTRYTHGLTAPLPPPPSKRNHTLAQKRTYHCASDKDYTCRRPRHLRATDLRLPPLPRHTLEGIGVNMWAGASASRSCDVDLSILSRFSFPLLSFLFSTIFSVFSYMVHFFYSPPYYYYSLLLSLLVLLVIIIIIVIIIIRFIIIIIIIRPHLISSSLPSSSSSLIFPRDKRRQDARLKKVRHGHERINRLVRGAGCGERGRGGEDEEERRGEVRRRKEG